MTRLPVSGAAGRWTAPHHSQHPCRAGSGCVVRSRPSRAGRALQGWMDRHGGSCVAGTFSPAFIIPEQFQPPCAYSLAMADCAAVALRCSGPALTTASAVYHDGGQAVVRPGEGLGRADPQLCPAPGPGPFHRPRRCAEICCPGRTPDRCRSRWADGEDDVRGLSTAPCPPLLVGLGARTVIRPEPSAARPMSSHVSTAASERRSIPSNIRQHRAMSTCPRSLACIPRLDFAPAADTWPAGGGPDRGQVFTRNPSAVSAAGSLAGETGQHDLDALLGSGIVLPMLVADGGTRRTVAGLTARLRPGGRRPQPVRPAGTHSPVPDTSHKAAPQAAIGAVGGRGLAAAAWIRLASSVRTTCAASVAVISVLRRVTAVDNEAFLSDITGYHPGPSSNLTFC